MTPDFPNTLKELRARKGITQAELAEALGVGKSTISMYEVGAREPDFEMLEAIADYFNVNLTYLVRSSGDTQKRAENLKLDGVYLSMAAKVREAGLTEKDLDIMLEMYKKAKELSGE